jgi:hypothetical protein
MTTLREAAQQALEALKDCVKALDALHAPGDSIYTRASDLADRAEIALRAALTQQEQDPVKPTMPITDDHGQAIKPQFQVIKAVGNWRLLYDQLCVGEAVRHEFRITKTTHDIALYPGISLADAIKRFDEKAEAEHE